MKYQQKEIKIRSFHEQIHHITLDAHKMLILEELTIRKKSNNSSHFKQTHMLV